MEDTEQEGESQKQHWKGRQRARPHSEEMDYDITEIGIH